MRAMLPAQEVRQHMEALQPAVAELARLETQAQQSFLNFKRQWAAAGA